MDELWPMQSSFSQSFLEMDGSDVLETVFVAVVVAAAA